MHGLSIRRILTYLKGIQKANQILLRALDSKASVNFRLSEFHNVESIWLTCDRNFTHSDSTEVKHSESYRITVKQIIA